MFFLTLLACTIIDDTEFRDRLDSDRDGFLGVQFGGEDCDDSDPDVNPSKSETWYDGADGNCDGLDDFDQDGDTYVPSQFTGIATFGVATSGTLAGGDCDDGTATVHPEADDVWYDGLDANCNGDDDYDQDGDGFPTATGGGSDCDDLDSEVNPTAAEIPDDYRDNNCLNDPPEVDSLRLDPLEIQSGDTVTAIVTGNDPDGDDISFAVVWTVDGTPVDGVTGTVLGAEYFRRDQVIFAAVTASDGELDSAPVTGDSITVQNSPPSITSLSLSNLDPSESDTVSAIVIASDADADPVSIDYQWFVDGTAVATTSTLGGSRFAKGAELWVVAVASDGTTTSPAATSTRATVVNSPPVLTAVTVSPNPLPSTSNVACAAGSVSDADGDAVVLDYAWTINGVDVGETSASLPATAFLPGDELYCTVTPDDGDDSGVAVASDPIVANTAPVVTGTAITPLTAKVGDTLSCGVASFQDDDGDGVTLSYVWWVNGVAISTDASLSSGFTKRDEVVCTVTPHDGIEFGESASSTTLLVDNSAPQVVSVVISPTTAYTDSTLQAAATVDDPDNDELTLRYEWSANGSIIGDNEETLDGGYFSRGDAVAVTVYAYDDDGEAGALGSATTTIQNSVPSVPTLEFRSDYPIAGTDPLVCDVATPAADADGDAVVYTFSWKRNGVAYVSATTTAYPSDTIVATAYAVGETWTCTALPTDALGAGTAASVSLVIPSCDIDNDGYRALACDGLDCDDLAGATHPDAIDVPYDGVDGDCGGNSDYDADNDGYDSDGYSGTDCDDATPTVNPGEAEVWYDGIDANCDELSDYDADYDGYPTSTWGGRDCDDSRASVNPDAVESCDGGLDNDCDGEGEAVVPTDYSSLQAAIDALPYGGLVCAERGTYYENIDFLGRRIELRGRYGSTFTTIDGGGADSVVKFVTSETSASILAGFTLTNGWGEYGGGGIYIQSASPQLDDLVITENLTPYSGGGLYGYGGEPTLTDVTFSENIAEDGGGAHLYQYCNAALTNVSFENNIATNEGGGLNVIYANPEFDGVSFVDNIARSGGGLAVSYFSSPLLSDITLSENEATEDGGGLYVGTYGSPRIVGITIENNKAGSGAGIFGDRYSNIEIADSTLTENEADAGAAVFSIGGTLTLDNVVITGNTAIGGGAGVYADTSDVTLTNVAITGNTAMHGTAVYSRDSWSLSHPMVLRNVVITGNTSGGGNGSAGFYAYEVAGSLTNVTIAGNYESSSYGGGVLIYASEFDLTNVNITSNSSKYGGGVSVTSSTVNFTSCNVWDNAPANYWGITDPTGTNGNISVDPSFLSATATDASEWDVHLGIASPLIDAGSGQDPDGGPSDIGAYGGDAAGTWDLDTDGWALWWQPGAYDPGYAAAGWDCDDADAESVPGNGC